MFILNTAEPKICTFLGQLRGRQAAIVSQFCLAGLDCLRFSRAARMREKPLLFLLLNVLLCILFTKIALFCTVNSFSLVKCLLWNFIKGYCAEAESEMISFFF